MSNSIPNFNQPGSLPARLKKRFTAVVLALGVSFVLAGCAEDFPMTVVLQDYDYRLKHPLKVKTGTAITWISFSGQTAALGFDDISKLGRYFASYIEAGQSQIKVTVSRHNISDTVVTARVQALKSVALQEGLKAREIQFKIVDTVSAPSGPVAAKLGYLRYVAELPPCPDWSKDAIVSSKNTDHSNFGCATQSNFGAMVIDPADLVRMRPMVPSDAEIGDNAIRVLRIPPTTAPTVAPAGAATGGAN